MRRMLAALCLLPALAFASTGNFKYSKPLANVPGYGYEITAQYETTSGAFNWTLQVSDNYGLGAPWQGIRLASILDPVPSPTTTESFEMKGSMDIRFVNLATGMTAIPPQVFDAHWFERPHPASPFHISSEAWSEARIKVSAPNVGVDGVRLSESTLSQTWRMSNQNGPILLDGTNNTALGYDLFECFSPDCDMGSANASAHFEFAASFNAGQYLIPEDLACNTVDCMVLKHDNLWMSRFELHLAISEAPEPASSALFTVGLAGLLLHNRRRKTH